MDKVLLSTAYFPPIDYFYLLVISTNVSIETSETYLKQTYRNRCYIYSPNGKQALTIPIHKVDGNHTKTKDVLISRHSNWRVNHWRSIQTAYNSSAYFMYYKNELWEQMQHTHYGLLEYNTHLLQFLMNEIGIKTNIHFTKNFLPQTTEEFDMRTLITPKQNSSIINTPSYYQLFSDKHGFIHNLSILDLLFNEGPNTLNYLQSLKTD